MSIDVSELSLVEKITLLAVADACHNSTAGRASDGAIASRLRSDRRGDAKKGLKKLVKRRLVYSHPSGRNLTYFITIEGLKLAEKIRQQWGA